MKLNRLTSLSLTVALCASLLVAPAGAATFSDVTDPALIKATDLLHELGIVSGTGSGLYNPQGSFSRAEFCKMALTAMGRGGEAALQAGRVIFEDVTSGWAVGYVNAAATAPDEKTAPLMRGKGNSLFEPNAAITYGEAVTVLMRALGYTDSDVALSGSVWYAGYLAQANTIGLTEGVAKGGLDQITRGEAALLFENLLFTETKTDKKPFFAVKLGGSVTEPSILLSLTATTPDGSKNAVKTADKLYKTSGAFDASLLGTPCKLVLDKNEKVLSILPDETVTSRSIRITAEPEARYLLDEKGEKIIISKPEETPIWRADKDKSTYDKEYMSLKLGTQLKLCYDAAGNLSYLYILGAATNASAMVAQSGSSGAFAAITGADSDFTVYKNGSPATLGDVREYDVGTYSAGVLSVSDRRLTGIYGNAKPSPASPSKITVMGAEFHVLDCGLDDLVNFKIGDPITILLSEDNEVAGAVKPSVLAGTALGVASVTGSGEEQTAEVTLTSGIKLSGTVSLTAHEVKNISGKLVAVSSQKLGELTLTNAESAAPPAAWNLAKGTVGDLRIASGATIYERIGASKLYPVKPNDITVATVPADQITYVGTNFSGEVDLLILENVTGDHFSYGFPKTDQLSGSSSSGLSYENPSVTVVNNAKENPTLISTVDFTTQVKKQLPIGITPSLAPVGNSFRLSTWISLTAVSGVRRSDFSEETVMVNGKEFPLASDLDSHCYNASAKNWFDSLNDAKAYATRLTVYYDRPASQGGKIRLVVVE